MTKKQKKILEKIKNYSIKNYLLLKIGSDELISEYIIKFRGTCVFEDDSIGIKATIYGESKVPLNSHKNAFKDSFFLQSIFYVELLNKNDAGLFAGWHWLSNTLKRYLYGI